MSTFNLSGSGTHALTAGTTGLQVTITTVSVIGGIGRSSPTARYDQGLLRFSDGTSYWAPVPILGGPQFIPVPANATSMGYALLGGAVVSITEVIGGTVFFSSPSQSVATLSDVLLASLADGQVLAWNAGATKWENVTPATGGGAGDLTLISSQVLVATAASVTFSGIAATYRNLRIEWQARGDHASAASRLYCQLNSDTAAHYEYEFCEFFGGSTSVSASTGQGQFQLGFICGASASAGEAASGTIEMPNYVGTAFFKQVLARDYLPQSGSGPEVDLAHGEWHSTAAVTSIKLYPDLGSFVAGCSFSLYGLN